MFLSYQIPSGSFSCKLFSCDWIWACCVCVRSRDLASRQHFIKWNKEGELMQQIDSSQFLLRTASSCISPHHSFLQDCVKCRWFLQNGLGSCVDIISRSAGFYRFELFHWIWFGDCTFLDGFYMQNILFRSLIFLKDWAYVDSDSDPGYIETGVPCILEPQWIHCCLLQ